MRVKNPNQIIFFLIAELVLNTKTNVQFICLKLNLIFVQIFKKNFRWLYSKI